MYKTFFLETDVKLCESILKCFGKSELGLKMYAPTPSVTILHVPHLGAVSLMYLASSSCEHVGVF